jgi:succinate dehydrogenase flavin-adding protein (antitoxin of CptAB toxin-antitoxin module)
MSAEDPDIWAWVMGFQEMPEQREIANVIEQLRVHY